MFIFSKGSWSFIVDEAGILVKKNRLFEFRTRSLREAVRKARLEGVPLKSKSRAIIVEDYIVQVFRRRKGLWIESILLMGVVSLFALQGAILNSWFLIGGGLFLSAIYFLMWTFPWYRNPLWDWRWKLETVVNEKQLFEALLHD